MTTKPTRPTKEPPARERPTSVFDRKDPHPERLVKPDPAQKRLQAALDEALEETFPASDPVAMTQPTTPGVRKSARKTRR